jgi:protein TilB
MFKDYKEFDEANKKKDPISVYNQFGDIRQANEGKYEFKFSESQDKVNVILELWVPKFMDTSLVNIDLNPTYVRIEIKGKITQLKFPDEIIVSKSKVQRSTTTGVLMLTCQKANLTES